MKCGVSIQEKRGCVINIFLRAHAFTNNNAVIHREFDEIENENTFLSRVINVTSEFIFGCIVICCRNRFAIVLVTRYSLTFVDRSKNRNYDRAYDNSRDAMIPRDFVQHSRHLRRTHDAFKTKQ